MINSDNFDNFEDMFKDPDDDNNSEDAWLPSKEEIEMREQAKRLMKKLSGEDTSKVTNKDILQYIRIINFNFIALSKTLKNIFVKQAVTESVLVSLLDKLETFSETASILGDSLDDPADNT